MAGQRPPVYKQRPLPYKLDALEPHISRRAVEQHWGRHYGRDVAALHELTGRQEHVAYPLEDLILDAYNNGNPLPHFNSASQVYNHELAWESMEPGGGRSPPEGELRALLERDFGSVRLFWDEFRDAALSLFGAGYVWLVVKPERLTWNQPQPGPATSPYIVGKLAVVKTANAVNPLVWGHIPLLCLDVWEHAYYLDYLDNRRAYVDVFQGSLACWGAAAARLARAKAAVNMYPPELPREIEEHLRGMERRAEERGTLTPATQDMEPQVSS